MVRSLALAAVPALVAAMLPLSPGHAMAAEGALPAHLVEALATIEQDPVRAVPEAIDSLLDQCRAAGAPLCEARALLARAECFAEAALVSSVVEDAAAAEAILRAEGGRDGDLARALLLQRGSGTGGGGAVAVKGRERYAEGLTLARRGGDAATEGRIQCEWAKLEATTQQFDAFLEHLDAAAAIAARGRLPRVAACVAYRRGLAKYARRDGSGAREIWDAFAGSDLAEEAPRELLWILVGAAAASIDLADPQPALSHARRARKLGESIQGRGDQIPAYCNLSTASLLTDHVDESEETARLCLDLGGLAGRRDTEALGSLRLGSVAYARGELVEAEELTRHALALSREIQLWPQVPWCLLTLGDILVDAGKGAEAIGLLEQALGMADRFGPPSQRAIMRTSLSRAHSKGGDLVRAGLLIEEALRLIADSGSSPLLADAIHARGIVRYQKADYEAALEDFARAETLHDEAGRHASRARVAIDAGNTNYMTNRYDLALAAYTRAYRLATEADARVPLSTAAGNLALLRRFNAVSARDRMELVELSREAAESASGKPKVNALTNLANILLLEGRVSESEAVARRAVAASTALQALDVEADARSRLALALIRMNRQDEALQECRLIHSGRLPMTPAMTMRSLHRCGIVARSAGDFPWALEMHRAALDHAERAGGRLSQSDLKASFIENRVGFYAALIRTMMDAASGHPDRETISEMFALSERFRGQILLESFSRADGLDAETSGTARLSLAQIQESLDTGSAALEYIFGLEASFLFVITREEARVFQLDGFEELWEPVRVFRGLLERRGRYPKRDLRAIRASGAALHGSLLAPADALLHSGIRRLIISPEGPLHFLPFESLVLPGDGEVEARFLVERFEVSLVPSMSVLHHLRSRESAPRYGRTFAGFANPELPGGSAPTAGSGSTARSSYQEDLPPLPYSEEEVKRVSRLVGGPREIKTGREVSEESVRTALEADHAIVHVATHGFLDSTSFGKSGLILSPAGGDDGILEALEVSTMEVNAGMVVLSGCTTGGGRLVRGEGFVGLPHALFQAGARSVVTSLWAVGDRSAALFMERFYASMGRGMEVGAALRDTKIGLIRSGRAELAHPSVWAPFVISGISNPGLDLPPPETSSRAAWVGGALLAALAGVAALRISRRRARQP